MTDSVDLSTISPEQLSQILSQLSPEQLAQLPAGRAPDGQLPNLIDPPTVGYQVIAVTSVLTAMMLVFVFLRFYVVFRIKRKMAPDDWAAIPSAIGALYYFIVICLSVKYIKFGTHLWNLSLLQIKADYTPKISFLSNFPALLIFPIIKTTYFLMYIQLFRPLTWLRNCAYGGLVITWCFYIAVGVTQLVFTLPAPGQSWSEVYASPRYLRSINLCVPTSSFSLAMDTFILILPIIAISHLHLSASRKLGAAAMFSTGAICCVASSLAVYFQYRIWKNQNDYTYWVIYVLLAYSVEMCVGISTSCMPSLARLHKHGKGEGRGLGLFASTIGSSVKRFLKTKSSNASNTKASSLDEQPIKASYAASEESKIIESYGVNDDPEAQRDHAIVKSHTVTQTWSRP